MVFKPPIFDVVAKSPFKLLQQHMAEVHSCVSNLSEFFQSSLEENWEKSLGFLVEISNAESRADEIKLDICNNLHGGIFLPVSREQILNLLMKQDALANISEDIAGLVYGRKMIFPKSLHDDLINYVNSSINTCGKAKKAIGELSQVLESGFSGSVQNITAQIIADINDLESENDHIQRDIRNKFFAIENEIPPLHAMFLYKLLKQIGAIADNSLKVGTNIIIIISR
jgi:predicted phosphate transport protein (TIGR00153 family)